MAFMYFNLLSSRQNISSIYIKQLILVSMLKKKTEIRTGENLISNLIKKNKIVRFVYISFILVYTIFRFVRTLKNKRIERKGVKKQPARKYKISENDQCHSK